MKIRRTSNKETTAVPGSSGVEEVENDAGLEFSLAVKGGEPIVSFGKEYNDVAEGASDDQIIAAVREKIAIEETELDVLREFLRVAEKECT